MIYGGDPATIWSVTSMASGRAATRSPSSGEARRPRRHRLHLTDCHLEAARLQLTGLAHALDGRRGAA